ncbi:MAG: helix-hairpin-helix domain-containing protein [Bacteroidia bacterium]
MVRAALLALIGLHAQVVPDTLFDSQRFEMQLEDQAEDAPESIDWTQLSDIYSSLLQNPVDLNSASDRELLQIPGMMPWMVQNLRAHQKAFGPLLSIYELQAVPGFSKEVFEKIRPFVRVREGTVYDIPQNLPRGPTWQEIQRATRITWIQRHSYLQQATFTHKWQNLPNPYVGPLSRRYTRLRWQAGKNLSAALIGESDHGEPFQWQPQNRYYGYDFWTGHVFLADFGKLRRLVLGDFIAQFGQGIILARGLGFGKSGDAILPVKQPSYGIIPYTSVNEWGYFRGAATTVGTKTFSFTVLGARQRWDATPQKDTLEEEVFIQTVLQSGLHRTPSELTRRQNLPFQSLGSVIEFHPRSMHIGFTQLYHRFDTPLNLTGRFPYQYYNFQGKNHFLHGFFGDLSLRNVNLFGEIARTRQNAYAGVIGMLAALDPTVEIALQMRHFAPSFVSFYGYTFAERPFAVQNEQGMYFGIKIRPTYRWEISGFIDLYRFPWYRYRVNGPSQGFEHLVQILYRPSKKFQTYIRFRYEEKPYNQSPPSTRFYALQQHRRWGLRGHYVYALLPAWRLQGRIELSLYQRENTTRGILFYQELRWQPTFAWHIALRYANYDIDSYDARIYTYELQVPTTFSIPVFYGQGHRVYALIRWRWQNWTLWVRGAQTLTLLPTNTYFPASKLNRTQEITIQVRYQFIASPTP